MKVGATSLLIEHILVSIGPGAVATMLEAVRARGLTVTLAGVLGVGLFYLI